MKPAGVANRLRGLALRARRVRRTAASRLLGSPLLSWRYGAVGPRVLQIAPQDMRSRDPCFWPEVQSGFLGLAGASLEIGDQSPFDFVAPGPAFERALHGFAWLGNIDAAAEPDAEDWARDIVIDWIARGRQHPVLALAPDVRARRIISWLSNASFLLDLADADEFDAITRALSADVASLSADWRMADGPPRLSALSALALARLAFDDGGEHLPAVTALLVAEIDQQVLLDGGHISRNPAALIDVLLDWLPLKSCFDLRQIPVPAKLTLGIERGIGMLRYLRLGDGGIARFNGMGIADPGALATLMSHYDRPAPDWVISPASRYARMACGTTVVVMDAGGSPPLDHAGQACAGALSFEASSGQALLFVNVGAPGPSDADWHALSRATASHSTVCLADTSSAQLVREAGRGEQVPLVLHGQVKAVATAKAGAAAIETSHDGYGPRFGVVHARRLTLSDDGDLIEGTDRIEPVRRSAGAGEVPFAVHFHLHPSTTLAPFAEGMTGRTVRLVLRLSDGSEWLFVADGARATIEESTFLAGGSGPRPSLQIVLRGSSIGSAEIHWSVSRSNRAIEPTTVEPTIDHEGTP